MKDVSAMENYGEILIYQSDDGLTNVEVKIQDETVWLTQQQMAELFQTSRTNVVEHIKHIYDEGNLDKILTCRKFRQVRKEGQREVARKIPFYNLDMINSLGYRVKSIIEKRDKNDIINISSGKCVSPDFWIYAFFDFRQIKIF